MNSIFPIIYNPLAENETEDKIRSFAFLEKGWCYLEGVPIEKHMIDKGIILNRLAVNAGFETGAFPGLNGEVRITIYHGKHYLEFTLEPNGTATFVRMAGEHEEVYLENLTFSQAKKLVTEFIPTWQMSDFSTGFFTITSCIDSKALPSKIQPEEEFQLLILTASLYQETPYATTSNSSTPITVATPSSIGTSHPFETWGLPAH